MEIRCGNAVKVLLAVLPTTRLASIPCPHGSSRSVIVYEAPASRFHAMSCSSYALSNTTTLQNIISQLHAEFQVSGQAEIYLKTPRAANLGNRVRVNRCNSALSAAFNRIVSTSKLNRSRPRNRGVESVSSSSLQYCT